MRIAWTIHDYREANLPLQPWLTVDRVGRWLAGRDHEIHVITDTDATPHMPDIAMHRVRSLRGHASGTVTKLLRELQPDCVVATVTPLNLATTPWFGAPPARWFGFAPYAFYRVAEIARAARWVRPIDLLPYARHLLVPAAVWGRALHKRFHGVVCQSARTAERLRTATGGRAGIRFATIPPGIECSTWSQGGSQSPATRGRHLLYVGATRAIRGFPVLLRAMWHLADDDVRLRVLARGAGPAQIETMRRQLAVLGLEQRIEIVGGWLSPEALVQEVRMAAAVVLPFVLVPSELPVSVLEAIAAGTPVIATDIDGLPAAVGDAGLIVPAGDSQALADALSKVCRDENLRRHLCERASAAGQGIVSWDEAAMQWLKLLSF